MLCYVILYYIILCYVMLYYVSSSGSKNYRLRHFNVFASSSSSVLNKKIIEKTQGRFPTKDIASSSSNVEIKDCDDRRDTRIPLSPTYSPCLFSQRSGTGHSSFAVRGTTVARPEGYCQCWDKDHTSIDFLSATNNISRMRKNRRRRELQREVRTIKKRLLSECQTSSEHILFENSFLGCLYSTYIYCYIVFYIILCYSFYQKSCGVNIRIKQFSHQRRQQQHMQWLIMMTMVMIMATMIMATMIMSAVT